MSNDDLLRPTLSAYSRPPALYHTTGFALAAFFGGPVGAAVYSLANTGRLSRLKQDAPAIVIVTAPALLIPMMLAAHRPVRRSRGSCGHDATRCRRDAAARAWGSRASALLYFMHRRFFRAARVSGVKTLPSWPVGIAAAGRRLGGKCRADGAGFSSIIEVVNDQPANAAVYAEQAFYFIERRRLARRETGSRTGAHAISAGSRPAVSQCAGRMARRRERSRRRTRCARCWWSTPRHAPARQLLASVLIERGEYADAELLLIGLLREYPGERGTVRALFAADVAHAAPGEGGAARARRTALRPGGRRMPAGGGAVRDGAQRRPAERRAAETAGRASGIDELACTRWSWRWWIPGAWTKRIALRRARCASIRPTNIW